MTPVEKLAEAIQEFITATSDEGDEAAVLVSSVVIYEQVTYGEDGEILRRVDYTVPTPATYSSTIGLLHLGRELLVADYCTPSDDQ